MSKIVIISQIIIGSFLGIASLVFVLNRVIPFPPLEVDDFVVGKNSEIILFSPFNRTFYIYSPDLKIIKRFKRPETKGLTKMVIDENDCIYTVNRGELYKYDMNGSRQLLFWHSSDQSDNWRLTPEEKVECFSNESVDRGNLFATTRLRRIAKPGDILFFETSKSDMQSIQDPFTDDNGNKYVCKNWFYGIQVYNQKGELIKNLKLPFFLRPFAMPFPVLYLWLTGLALMVIISFFFKNREIR